MFWKFALDVAFFATVINGSCPSHMDAIFTNNGIELMACEPYHCLCIDDSISDVVDCSDSYSTDICFEIKTFKKKFLSPSCHWVKLLKGIDFSIDISNNVTLYENKTNLTYPFGDFIYNAYSKEAYICRENLLPGDRSDNISLWCSMVNNTVSDDSLLVSGLNYRFKIDDEYDCVNTNIDFLRSYHGILNITEYQFQLLPNWDLLDKGIYGLDDVKHPLGSYYISYDKTLAVISIVKARTASVFIKNIYPLYIVSIIFCLLTLLVHLALPKIKFHTKSLLCHVFSMMLMYIALTLRYCIRTIEWIPGRIMVFGFFYVTLMGTFMWLNVIAYDLWKVFAKLRGTVTQSLSDERLRLALKCLYAWGVPILVWFIIIGITHDKPTAKQLGFELITAHFPFPQSSLSDTFYWIFIHGPIATILLINLVFFVLTIWNIRAAGKGSKILNKNINKKLFQVFVKLFVVMGILWLADIGASFVGESEEPYFYAFSVLNALQGVALFLIYVCKKSTWNQIKKRYREDYGNTATKSSVVSRSRLTSTCSISESEKKNRDKENTSITFSTIQQYNDVDY
ncbi:hypothetical protein CHUAL_007648 [Chamberlinius hualienensis]